MLVVIGEFRMPPEHAEAAADAMAKVIAASRAEPGCLAYAYAEDVLEKGLFRVNEAWESRAALRDHFATDHMREWQEQRARFGMNGRRVAAYDAGEEELL